MRTINMFLLTTAQSKVFERGYASTMRLLDSSLNVRRHYTDRELNRGRIVLKLCRCMGERDCKRRHLERNAGLMGKRARP
jgi:hypothetical protein